MDATIDRFGRIVIPKELRDLFGLRPGSILKVVPTDQAITLKPVDDTPQVSRKKGVLVISTDPGEDLDIVEYIKKMRDERIQHVSGMSGAKKK